VCVRERESKYVRGWFGGYMCACACMCACMYVYAFLGG